MPMVLLSGFVFPIENMPEVIQWFTYLIPLRYFLLIPRPIFLKGVGCAAGARAGGLGRGHPLARHPEAPEAGGVTRRVDYLRPLTRGARRPQLRVVAC